MPEKKYDELDRTINRLSGTNRSSLSGQYYSAQTKEADLVLCIVCSEEFPKDQTELADDSVTGRKQRFCKYCLSVTKSVKRNIGMAD